MIPRYKCMLSFAVMAGLLSCGGSNDDAGSTSGPGASSSATAESSASSAGSGGASSSSSSTGTSMGGGGAGGCQRVAGPADAKRFVVVGHPYDAMSNEAKDYEVLELSAAGALATTGKHFEMSTTTDGEIVFTPDGKLGFTAQKDGSIGEFRVNDDGSVDVLQAAFPAKFYASRVVMSPAGDYLLVLDEDFQASGGGVYRVDIGCDDAMTDAGILFQSKGARAGAFLSSSEFVVAGREALGAPLTDTALRIKLGAMPSLAASVDAFGDTDAIVSWLSLTHDGKYALIPDDSSFGGPNRIAVVGVQGNGLTATELVPMLDDPFSLATSPFDDAAIMVSGFGDAVFILDYDAAAMSPFTLRGELPYIGSKPQVPGGNTMVARGMLSGRVMIADVRGVYQVQFAKNATVTDLGVFDLGGGTETIVGAIGAQP